MANDNKCVLTFEVSRMEGGMCQIENDREIRGDIHPDDVPGGVLQEFGSLFDDLPNDFVMKFSVSIEYHKGK